MLALHCHTSFGLTIHGLSDTLKNSRSVEDQGTAILKVLQ
jgi:hypothetical protein